MKPLILWLLFASSLMAQRIAPPLPPSVYAALSNSRVKNITLPPGRWSIAPGKELTISRSDVTLDCRNAVLECVSPSYLPIGVRTDSTHREATGTVMANTDALEMEPTGLKPGHVVLVKVGVNYSDPQEPLYGVFRVVAKIVGKAVTFDKPFGIAAHTYTSYEELGTLSGQPEKCGPYGGTNAHGYFQRGLGTSHQVYSFPNGQPPTNVTILGPTINWQVDSRSYGAWAVWGAYARNLKIIDARVNNPLGSAVHFIFCENSGVDGLTITGRGGSNPFGGAAPIYPAVGFSLWGGVDNYARRILIDAPDVRLSCFESGSIGTLVEDAVVRSPSTINASAQHFGAFGPQPGMEYRNITLDIPQGSSTVFTVSLHDDTKFNGIVFPAAAPDWIHLYRYQWGAIRIGTRRFSAPKSFSVSFLADRDGFQLPLPAGLVRSAKVTLESRDGVRGITAPGGTDVFGEGLEFPLTPDELGVIRIGETFEGYRARIEHSKIWINPGATVRATLSGEVFGL